MPTPRCKSICRKPSSSMRATSSFSFVFAAVELRKRIEGFLQSVAVQVGFRVIRSLRVVPAQAGGHKPQQNDVGGRGIKKHWWFLVPPSGPWIFLNFAVFAALPPPPPLVGG